MPNECDILCHGLCNHVYCSELKKTNKPAFQNFQSKLPKTSSDPQKYKYKQKDIYTSQIARFLPLPL